MDVRRHPHHGVTFAILAIAGMSYALLQSLVLPALRTIQEDLGTTTTAAAWILTAYLLSASIATPIAGRLGDMFGKKRTFVVVLAILGGGDVHLGDRDDDRRHDRRPRDPGRVRGDLPAGLRDHPRRVPGSSGGRAGSRSSRRPRRRAAASASSSPAPSPSTSRTTGSSGSRWSRSWSPAIAAWVVIPESPVRTPGHVERPRCDASSPLWLVALLLGISEGSSWGWTSSRVLGLFVVGAVLMARVDPSRVALAAAARRHADDEDPRRLDDEPRRAPPSDSGCTARSSSSRSSSRRPRRTATGSPRP